MRLQIGFLAFVTNAATGISKFILHVGLSILYYRWTHGLFGLFALLNSWFTGCGRCLRNLSGFSGIALAACHYQLRSVILRPAPRPV